MRKWLVNNTSVYFFSSPGLLEHDFMKKTAREKRWSARVFRLECTRSQRPVDRGRPQCPVSSPSRTQTTILQVIYYVHREPYIWLHMQHRTLGHTRRNGTKWWLMTIDFSADSTITQVTLEPGKILIADPNTTQLLKKQRVINTVKSLRQVQETSTSAHLHRYPTHDARCPRLPKAAIQPISWEETQTVHPAWRDFSDSDLVAALVHILQIPWKHKVRGQQADKMPGYYGHLCAWVA